MNKLKRKGLSGRLGALALSAAMVSVLPSCGPADQEKIARTGKVMVIGKADPDQVSFWKDVRSGAMDAGQELGYEVTFQSAENDNDIDLQKGFINDAIRDNYDVIVIAPNSTTELNEDLDKAAAQGIKIININSSCENENVACLIASADGAAASSAVDESINLIRESSNGKLAGAGRIGIIGHTAATADARIKVYKNRMSNMILMDMDEAAAEAEEQYIIGPDGEQYITPSAAAQRAVQAASKAGKSSDEITAAGVNAAEEARNALVAAGVEGYENPDIALGAAPSNGGESDSTGDLISPEEAAEKAAAAAKAAGAPEQAIQAAAENAAKEAAEAIEKAKAAGGGDSDEGDSEEGEIVNVEDLPTPEEAAAMASEAAKANGAPEQAIQAAAEAAAKKAAEDIEKAKAGLPVTPGGPPSGVSGGDSSGDSGETPVMDASSILTAKTFPEIQASYFVEGDRCNTTFEAFDATNKLLDPDGDGVADETGIRLIYATNTNTTLGACQAIDKLNLADTVSVVGFNSSEEELAYLKTGVLDATIVQNPYSMGYLGVTYAKKLVDGDKITKNINTGITLLTAENINDDYIQILLYPDQSISISEDTESDKKSEDSQTSEKADDNSKNGGNE